MTTFALIHGAQHGSWCWKLLQPELLELGCDSVAMDLPVEDPTAGLEAYVSTVVDALAHIDHDNVVIVGHSMAGMVAPIVATNRPARAVVYLCGVVPVPGKTMADVLQEEPDLEQPGVRSNASTLTEDGVRMVEPDVGRELYYHDAPAELAEWASARLRPTADTAVYDKSPLDEFPPVKTVSIIGTEDRVVNPDWSRRVAQSRLGISCIELQTGHAPMLSKPAELAGILAKV